MNNLHHQAKLYMIKNKLRNYRLFVYIMYILYYVYIFVYIYINVLTHEGNSRNEILHWMKLE